MSDTETQIIEIKSRWTGRVLFSRRSGALKIAVEAAISLRADLLGADLLGADLSGADLSGAYLSRAYLSRADLSHANLSHANLSHANLSGADLSGANHIIPLGTPNGWLNAYAYCKDGAMRVQIGCRNFTLAEGREYWSGKTDRREVLAALDYAETVAKLREWEI